MHPAVKPGHTFVLLNKAGEMIWRWDWIGHGKPMYVEVDGGYHERSTWPGEAGPRLALDGDSFDLGVVKAGASIQRTIDSGNEGTQPLEVTIADVRSATKLGCEG